MKFKFFLAVLSFLFISIYSNAQSKVELEIKTGSDDLATRDFQENLEIRIKVQGKPDIVQTNVNVGRRWPNNSIRRVTINLDPTTTVAEIKEVILLRKNVNGFLTGNDAVADNWNLQKIVATATISKDGVASKYSLLTVEGDGGKPLYRFVYGPSQNANEGQVKSFPVSQPMFVSSNNGTNTITPTRTSTPTVADRTVHSPGVIVAPPSDNKIDIDLKTGGDNLEMKPHQDNVEIRIIIQNRPDVILQNVNKDQNWPNNSIRRVSIPLPADITAEMIKEIHIYRNPKDVSVKYIWDLRDQDNWNLQSINAFATIKTNGIKRRVDFEPLVSVYRGSPLYRFTYDIGNGETEGRVCKKVLTLKTTSAPPTPGTTSENAKLDISIGTGGDDLRGGNDNAEIVLSFISHPGKVTIRNIFGGANLPNFSERKRTPEIPNSANLNIYDIKEVELRHTGGGGMGADNWDVDKVKISITKDGQTKVLVDRVDAPLHRFTGDTRRKVFVVPLTPAKDQSLK